MIEASRRVAGTKVPALIERTRPPSGSSPGGCVAGTKVPALIERADPARRERPRAGVLPELKFRPSLSARSQSRTRPAPQPVLPELKFRPSLSVDNAMQLPFYVGCVAGTKVPALIERLNRTRLGYPAYRVLPELKFRPSLSAPEHLHGLAAGQRVAGTKVPALIERARTGAGHGQQPPACCRN